jgi:hypothetical protein
VVEVIKAMDDREMGRMVAGAPDPAVHVGRAEIWRAARPPTDTWQSTARDLRKQPPRDTQLGGPKETRRAPPLARVRPHPCFIRRHLPHHDPSNPTTTIIKALWPI